MYHFKSSVGGNLSVRKLRIANLSLRKNPRDTLIISLVLVRLSFFLWKVTLYLMQTIFQERKSNFGELKYVGKFDVLFEMDTFASKLL